MKHEFVQTLYRTLEKSGPGLMKDHERFLEEMEKSADGNFDGEIRLLKGQTDQHWLDLCMEAAKSDEGDLERIRTDASAYMQEHFMTAEGPASELAESMTDAVFALSHGKPLSEPEEREPEYDEPTIVMPQEDQGPVEEDQPPIRSTSDRKRKKVLPIVLVVAGCFIVGAVAMHFVGGSDDSAEDQVLTEHDNGSPGMVEDELFSFEVPWRYFVEETYYLTGPEGSLFVKEKNESAEEEWEYAISTYGNGNPDESGKKKTGGETGYWYKSKDENNWSFFFPLKQGCVEMDFYYWGDNAKKKVLEEEINLFLEDVRFDINEKGTDNISRIPGVQLPSKGLVLNSRDYYNDEGSEPMTISINYDETESAEDQYSQRTDYFQENDTLIDKGEVNVSGREAYWLIGKMQDLEESVTFYDLFIPDENTNGVSVEVMFLGDATTDENREIIDRFVKSIKIKEH